VTLAGASVLRESLANYQGYAGDSLDQSGVVHDALADFHEFAEPPIPEYDPSPFCSKHVLTP